MEFRTRFILTFFFNFLIVIGQYSSPDTIVAIPITEKITIDGRLEESPWHRAMGVSNFTQRELSEGESASEKTRVSIIYDRENLYIGVWCYDREPEKLVAKKMRRDFGWGGEDNFEIIIDTYKDHRNSYLFVTNPNGARADAQVIDNGRRMNINWDGVWDVKTEITEEGWFAEFEIPFTSLKFRTQKEQIWGINFERNIRRKREQVTWQGWSRDYELEQVSQAGTLIGLSGLEDVNLLEIKPFVLGGVQDLQEDGNSGTLDVGGDINYLITPTLKLNLTINTDFAQVESDRAQINLTRFSQFYPEQREFFLEGKDYFDFSLGRRIQPFYSRRIGLSEERTRIPLIGGIRLLGKAGNATIGAMSIQTAAIDSVLTTNYSVFRWKQDVGEQSSLGLMGVGKFLEGRQNSVVGGDYLFSSTKFLGDKNLVIGAAMAGSYTSDAINQISDAERLYLDYPNDFIDFYMGWERSAKDFNPEAGFLRRENYQQFSAQLRITPRPTFLPGVRKLIFKPVEFSYYINDETGEMDSFFAEFRPLGISFKSGDFIEFNIIRNGENIIEDFEISDGIIISPAEYWFTRYEIQAFTFGGRPLFGGGSVSWGEFYDGDRFSWDVILVWRANKYISFSTDFSESYISLPSGSFDVQEAGGRLEYAFNPDLFGALFGQWNNEDDEVILNYRLRWIPFPGANLYFVVNQIYQSFSPDLVVSDTAVIVKVVWRFTN